MLTSPDPFSSSAGRRTLLIADDEEINRELLGEMLGDTYALIYASDGAQTLELIRSHRDTLSLVLLDILMPVMSGLDVLRALREDGSLSHIPVIVTTAERETEIESLKLGAIDFIPKPYPAAGVIQARVLRTIELFEDRDIIRSTERDELTGLYNREFFYRYALQLDQFHPDTPMDCILLDVNHFHMINERYGRTYADGLLRNLGLLLAEAAERSGGIACRKEADTFLLYCPHTDSYREAMDSFSAALSERAESGMRVYLRAGIYSNADRSIDIEQRFDRAKMAADTVRGSYTNNIGLYDNHLHEQLLFAEQLIEDFPAALAEGQFQVYYQPKFDVRPDTPVLSSAEALVRWFHPRLGLISPGTFIPLFEENGLIQKLDRYVWEAAARQIREWKDRLGYAVPVSVNVSRIDMYDPALPDTLTSILSACALTGRDFLLEVTESAYTQDSQQIIRTVEKLRDLGFQIEMDDFGTGYSSLSMISRLPIDALKLDMHFIRDAFKVGGNTHMLEVIIGMSDFLAVPIIAEGVETEEQLHALRLLGCDLVQGYFFSKPVPAAEFEAFILQKKEADAAAALKSVSTADKETSEITRSAVLRTLHRQEEPGAEGADIPADEPQKPGIPLRATSLFFLALAALCAAALFLTGFAVTRSYQRMRSDSDRYFRAQTVASDMASGSDYLTECVRCFVVTGEEVYLRDFYNELLVTRRRDRAVENLGALLEDSESSALQSLNAALTLSNELVETEDYAIRLMLETGDYASASVPDEIRAIPLLSEDEGLDAQALRLRAQSLVFGSQYTLYKDRIRENVSLCTQSLIQSSSQELEKSTSRLSRLVQAQTFVAIILLLTFLAFIILIAFLVRRPLTQMVRLMRAHEMIPPTGVEELRFVTRTYNVILRENLLAQEKLSHEASHDALTGLFNRGAYDLLMESADTQHMALILADVDNFKQVNDTYGHAMGDRILRRVADVLRQHFRSVDILCRLGGDEFGVVMTRVNGTMHQLVLDKIERINEMLEHPKDDLPPISLSVGVAFADRPNPKGDIFQDADEALYRIKQSGRRGCAIF